MKITVFSVEMVENWSCVTERSVPKHTTCYALTWRSHHMDGGNALGISAARAAVRPSPSASSARAPSVRITERGLWLPPPWKAVSAAPNMTPCLRFRQITGARSNVNWNHKIMEKKQKNKWVVVFFFTPFFNEKSKREWVAATLVEEEPAAGRPVSRRRPWLGAGQAGALRRRTRSVASRLPVLFCWFGGSLVGPRSPRSSLAFYCVSMPSQLEKGVSSLLT